MYPRALPVGDRAVTIELGAEIAEDTVARVRALDERLAAAAIPGVLESVPTYASLLVLYAGSVIPFAELSARLLAMVANLEPQPNRGALVEIPVLYDGEDLDDVASRSKVSREDVVALHSSREYAVMMLGFSPGFAYLGFVDERLRLPRRKTPRTRVPSGSVAIAGAQTGVYPRALPGGWNLLGRTSLEFFSAARTRPSLLMPGDRVRFRPADSLPALPESQDIRFTGEGVTVIESGLLTTIQDAGRFGLRRVAVPFAGYADPESADRANVCAGNRPGSPLLEICGPPVRLRFDKPTFVAMCGSRVEATLERSDIEGGRMSMPMDVSVRGRPGNVLHIERIVDGMRAHLAIAGLEPPRVLGSCSVDTTSRFLRPLQAGDSLPVGVFDSDRARREVVARPTRSATVRVILGPQREHFDDATIETFLASAFRVGVDSDRTGARLDGARLGHRGATEIVSDGMVPGCVQVPPDGRPIVMLADCPTTGGYPKIACVVGGDLGIVAQARPGETEIRFRAVTVEDVSR